MKLTDEDLIYLGIDLSDYSMEARPEIIENIKNIELTFKDIFTYKVERTLYDLERGFSASSECYAFINRNLLYDQILKNHDLPTLWEFFNGKEGDKIMVKKVIN